MGKLNYINRKSEGLKLGSIVAKDLGKRRRNSASHKDLSPLEIHLEGKNLTDDGLAEAAKGLEDALQHNADTVPTTRLANLNLTQNELTVKSLLHLAPSIRAAANDLEELDLSNNNICVMSDEDASDWETFLDAFSACRVLRKVNLANNNLEGIKAWEIIARVYTKSFLKIYESWEKNTVGTFTDDEPDEEEDDLQAGLISLQVTDVDAQSTTHSATVKVDARETMAHGLPSIPFIDLSSTNLNDGGALFLSYVIERHRWIQNAVSGNVWGPPTEGSGHASIIYLPNDSMGPNGRRVLTNAEVIPYHPFEATLTEKMLPAAYDRNADRRRSSSIYPIEDEDDGSGHRAGGRPPSQSSNTVSDELDSLRRKLQRGIIEEYGLHGVELWSTAIIMLTFVRAVMIRGKGPDEHSSSTADSAGHAVTPRVFRLPVPHHRDRSVDSTAATWSSPSNPALSSASSPGAVHGLSRGEKGLLSEQVERVGPLSTEAFKRIFRHLVDTKGVLSDAHLASIIKWGTSRETLSLGWDVRGKLPSVQKWRVLHGMGCLFYEGNGQVSRQ